MRTREGRFATRFAHGVERRLFAGESGATRAGALESISHLALKHVMDPAHAEACKANGDGDDAQRDHCRERHDELRLARDQLVRLYFVLLTLDKRSHSREIRDKRVCKETWHT